jgi:hypothetical protein
MIDVIVCSGFRANAIGNVIDNFGGGSVMVWGGINWTGRTELVVVPGGSMTG